MVVACGGGVIETEANVAALTAFYGVIFVDRNIDDIVDYLEGAGSYRPGLGDHPATIFERRLPLYKQCCDYQFTIAKGETDFDAVNSDFERLYLPPPRPPPAPPLSAFGTMMALTAHSVAGRRSLLGSPTRQRASPALAAKQACGLLTWGLVSRQVCVGRRAGALLDAPRVR